MQCNVMQRNQSNVMCALTCVYKNVYIQNAMYLHDIVYVQTQRLGASLSPPRFFTA